MTEEPQVTFVVRLTCLHMAVHTGRAWSDWVGTSIPCEVCREDRTIVGLVDDR